MNVFARFHERGPPRGFGEQGNKGIYFRGTGEQRPNFEGNRGTMTILGNREHKKANFPFLGNRGTSEFISGEQGNRYPPWEGLMKFHHQLNLQDIKEIKRYGRTDGRTDRRSYGQSDKVKTVYTHTYTHRHILRWYKSNLFLVVLLNFYIGPHNL